MTETNGSEALSSLTLENVRALLQQHIARVNAELYQIGRILNEVVDRRLTGEGAYGEALNHLGPAVKALSKMEHRRAAAAARRFPEEICVKYGVRRLGLLVLHGKRFMQEWADGDPGSMLVPVPCESGEVRQKPFSECTPDELARALGSCGRNQPTPVPRVEEYCAHLLREGIRRRFAGDALINVKAFSRAGRMHVSLKSVPVMELKLLAEAIRESLVPLDASLYRRTPSPHPAPRAAPSLTGIRQPSAAVRELRAP